MCVDIVRAEAVQPVNNVYCFFPAGGKRWGKNSSEKAPGNGYVVLVCCLRTYVCDELCELYSTSRPHLVFKLSVSKPTSLAIPLRITWYQVPVSGYTSSSALTWFDGRDLLTHEAYVRTRSGCPATIPWRHCSCVWSCCDTPLVAIFFR